MRIAVILTMIVASSVWGLDDSSARVRTPPATTQASIPETAAQVSPALPPQPEEKPDFHIESTQVKLLEVAEAPPLPGLPPVEGTMKMTIHTVSDPGIQDPPPAVTSAVPSALPPVSRLIDAANLRRKVRMVSISATVYDHSRTLLRFHLSGNG